MKDTVLRQRIIDELEFDPSIRAANIGVSVENGIVTLSGHVPSYAEKCNIEQTVRRVKDVRGVAEEITVRYSEQKKTDDDQIAARAANILRWDDTIPGDAVQVTVEKGWVTLTGRVNWHFQRVAAEESVRKLSGIIGVSNLITVEPHVKPSDVKKSIENALKRVASVEVDGVNIKVLNNKVILDGRVNSWHERTEVERAAWSTPGVSSVEDNLAVNN